MQALALIRTCVCPARARSCRTKGPRSAHAWNAALPVLYSVFSGLIGTQSVLFSKTLAVLLRSTLSGDNQVGRDKGRLMCVHAMSGGRHGG
jgi:hypothetical protein